MSTQTVCDNCGEIVTGNQMSGEHRISRNIPDQHLREMFFTPIKFDWCTKCTDAVLHALKRVALPS